MNEMLCSVLFVFNLMCNNASIHKEPAVSFNNHNYQEINFRFSLPEGSESELKCLTNNIYYEARDQSRQGKIAVSYVTLNRVKDSRFPSTICGVVKQKRNGVCQFSWYCQGHDWTPSFINDENQLVLKEKNMYKVSYEIALYTYLGYIQDNTQGATHYYNHNIVRPKWAKYYPVTVVYEDHTFKKRMINSPL